MVTTVDLIENFLQSELGTDNFLELLRIDKDQFAEFADRLYEFCIDPSSRLEQFRSNTTENELTAFVPLHSGEYFSLDRKDLYDMHKDFNNSLKLLLYFHGICIEDPFEHFLNNLTSFEAFKEKKDVLRVVLEYLQKLKPLVNENIIKISPLNYVYHESYNQQIKMLDDEDYNDAIIEVLTANYHNPYPFLDVNRGLISCSLLNSNLILQNPLAQSILKHKINRLKTHKLLYNSHLQKVVAPLVRMQVPNFEKIQIDDYVAIRKEELLFEEWRNDLWTILDELNRLNITGEDYEAIFTKVASQGLREAILMLEKRLDKISLKSKLISGAKSFGIGAIGAIVVKPSPIDVALTGLGASAASLLYSILFDRLTKGEKAQLKHYSLFY